GRISTHWPRVGSFLSSSTRPPAARGRGATLHRSSTSRTGRCGAAERTGGLLLDLALQLAQVLSRDVNPVLLGRQLRGERDVALPLRHRLFRIHLLVDEGEVVHGARVLAVDLDDLAVLLDGFLVEALVLVDLAEPHARLDRLRVEVDRLLVGGYRLVVEALLAVVDLPEA